MVTDETDLRRTSNTPQERDGVPHCPAIQARPLDHARSNETLKSSPLPPSSSLRFPSVRLDREVVSVPRVPSGSRQTLGGSLHSPRVLRHDSAVQL